MTSPRNIENIRVNKDGDLIFCTVGLYKFFMAHGRPGLQAKQVYDHLMFTARLQETNQVKANLKYLQTGLDLGRDKIKAAKTFLHEHSLIEYVQNRDETGSYREQYIKLNFMPTATSTKKAQEQTRPTESPLTGGLDSSPPDRWTRTPTDGSERQMLKKKKRNTGGEKGENPSLPISPKAEEKNTSKYRSIVDTINASVSWDEPLRVTAIRATFDDLKKTNQLRIEYLLYAAKQEGSPRHFHQALKDADYWVSWKQRIDNQPDPPSLKFCKTCGKRFDSPMSFCTDCRNDEFGSNDPSYDIESEPCEIFRSRLSKGWQSERLRRIAEERFPEMYLEVEVEVRAQQEAWQTQWEALKKTLGVTASV